MDDLTVLERANINSQLADVLDRWDRNADLDCISLSQALSAIAAQALRTLRERDAA